MSPTLRNKWEQTQCRKQEIEGRSMSDECIAARRLSSILNKAVMTIDYNEVSNDSCFAIRLTVLLNLMQLDARCCPQCHC